MMVYVNPNMPAIFEACHIAIMVAIEAVVVVAVVVAVVGEVAAVQLVLLLVLLLLQLVEHFGFVLPLELEQDLLHQPHSPYSPEILTTITPHWAVMTYYLRIIYSNTIIPLKIKSHSMI
jgi:hypothetical protein